MEDLLLRALTSPTKPSALPLPDDVVDLLVDLHAPARLGAHLRLVHDVACTLVDALGRSWPGLISDPDAVRYGAATHDIGKVQHLEELSHPGSLHEQAGYQLLLDRGVDEPLARFAATHASWHRSDIRIEDLVVSLADKSWKGHRVQDLEDQFITRVSSHTGQPPWEVLLTLDDLIGEISDHADARLDFQNAFPVRHTVEDE